ncbi:MAG: type I-F CRISPR-associated protein Csy2 [Selenomonadaceae bacterium]|nr:type I-F CRISPR-associated protein Csy2 [Selenomonadaceae bacterium]
MNITKTYLLIQKMEIHNANAMSSPYTVGFPAMTAWLGGIHALERRLRVAGVDVRLTSLAVSCHHFSLHTYKGRGDRYGMIVGVAKPIRKNSKGIWTQPSFIEEPRCDMNISLLIEIRGINGDNEDEFLRVTESLLFRQKMASGDIMGIGKLSVEYVDEESEAAEKKLLRRLMPGYVPIERRDLMMKEDSEGDALDRLLDYLKINAVDVNPDGEKPEWEYTKKAPGWIVPLAVGYKAISPLGKVANQRDPETPHCFAESVVTLGEFKMPYRFDSIDSIMWQYDASYVDDGLYLCTNQNKIAE